MSVNFPDSIDTWVDVVDEVDIISGADMNSAHNQILAVEEYLLDARSSVSVFRGTSGQTFTAWSPATVQFNEVEWDLLDEWESDHDYTITVLKSGYYIINSQIIMPTPLAYSSLTIYLKVDGVTMKSQSYSTLWAVPTTLQINTVEYLDAGADVRIDLMFADSSTKDITFSFDKCYLKLHMLHP